MIVTRRWLEEFVDLSGISDEKLYETFNSIGLEVDSMVRTEIPPKVVVGRVLSCEKHPDADKLNVCRVDTGDGERQIVCGAANVREAEYVPVALPGTVLPGDFEIKPAKLRGVESLGMICSSTELGLPETERGIMILDDSLGEMTPGRELGSLPDVADTVIELELTANRGDCLSVHGVARDLSAALERPLHPFGYHPAEYSPLGIAREIELHVKGAVEADLLYSLAECDRLESNALMRLRLAWVGEYREEPLAAHLAYATQATGVLLRAYDAGRLKEEGHFSLFIEEKAPGDVEISSQKGWLSQVGIRQNEEFAATARSGEILLEGSYIDPERLVPMAAKQKPETDSLYYRSSRGSEPNLSLGMEYLYAGCDRSGGCRFSREPLRIDGEYEPRKTTVDLQRLYAIIGQEIPASTVRGILQRLGFEIHGEGEGVFGVTIPRWRHDIVHLQDIAEEILRIVGINNIAAKPLLVEERNRITETTRRFRLRRDLRERAVAAGFYEAVTYAFAEKAKLERYGFPILEEGVDLINPIVEELNTLRSTLSVNLLEAAKRNLSYGKKRIPLFEIGSVFDRERREHEKLAFLWSGEAEEPNVVNHGKPPRIDFARFVRALGEVLGDFELVPCEEENALIHPYQSATLLFEGRPAGWLSRLHPKAAKEFGIEEDTYLAELDFEALIPSHRNAEAISNFQGVTKDLSLLVEKELPYRSLAHALEKLEGTPLRSFFPVDLYEEESLGERKSVTLRFFLQSEEGTLSDEVIEQTMASILSLLERECGARLR
ncbi:phenylalanine--tRNA ligase subunit beta [Nitratifractor sp.]